MSHLSLLTRKSWRWNALASVIATALIAPAATAQRPSRHVAALDSIAESVMRAGKVPGMAVLIMRAGDTLLSRGYGYADVESKRKVMTSSVFRIGSITKQFTAAAVLQLVEAGKLRLTDSLHLYLPTLRGPARNATIHQLLSHTSGIPSYTELPAFRAKARSPILPTEMLRMIDTAALRFAHGEQWAYNNSGYYLLGLVIERAAGVSYAAYVQRAILLPNGLRQTGYCGSPEGVAETVVGYDVEEGAVSRTGDFSMANPFAAGALCSSAQELGGWLRTLMGGHVITAGSLQRMLTPVSLPGGRRTAYGYGLEVTELGGRERIGHGGSIPGFDAYAAFYPESSFTVIVLTNNGSANAEAIEKTFARQLLGIASLSIRELPLPKGTLAMYVGSYRAGPGRVVVTQRGERLHVAGPVDADLAYIGDHTFVLVDEPDVKLAFRVEVDSATSIAWTSRGRTLTLPRVP